MKKFVILLILATTILFALSACNGNSEVQEGALPTDMTPPTTQQTEPSPLEPETESGTRHYFHNLGFSVEFPAFWEGKYGLDEFEVELDFGTRYFVAVYHIATRQELLEEFGDDQSGRILSLGMSPRDHYSYEGEMPIMAGASILLAQQDGKTFFVSFPSGVEYSENPDSAAAAEYLEMVGNFEPNHWDFLVNSFRLVESEASQ